MKYFWPLLLIAGCCGECCHAQIVRLETFEAGKRAAGKATAVCIGETDEGDGVFVTAAHNFRDCDRARIAVDGRWHSVTRLNTHRTADVASFEARVKTRPKRLAESIKYGERVWLHGFGPEYNRTGQAEPFCGTITESEISGCYGWHPVPGDSGGPIVQDDAVVGVISGFVETMARPPA